MNLLVLHNLRNDVCGITVLGAYWAIGHHARRVWGQLFVLLGLQTIDLHGVILHYTSWTAYILIKLRRVGLARRHLYMMTQSLTYFKSVAVFGCSYCLEELRPHRSFTSPYVLSTLDRIHRGGPLWLHCFGLYHSVVQEMHLPVTTLLRLHIVGAILCHLLL